MTLAATTSEIDLASMVQHKLSEEKFHKIKSVVETPSSLVRFNPLQPFRKTWDILLSFLLAFNLIEIPFVVGFSLLQGIESGIFWLNRIVDMIFIGVMKTFAPTLHSMLYYQVVTSSFLIYFCR